MSISLSALMTSFLGLPAGMGTADSDDDTPSKAPAPKGAEDPGALADDAGDQRGAPDSNAGAGADAELPQRLSGRRTRRRQGHDPSPRPLPVQSPKDFKPPDPPKLDETAKAVRTGKRRLRRV
jgi:hypothetical protein